MLQVHSLSFDYGDRPLLQNLDFSLPAGRLLHLRGDNGAGKTSLLKLLAALLSPTRGDITWEQRSIHDDRSAWQQMLCFVGHRPGLSPQLSARENCYYDRHWRGQGVLDDLFERFNLADLADIPCGQLSAGQQRRVALLRLAMTDAKIWLLDEPLVALDEDAIALLASCLREHLDKQGLIIMTSHQALPPSLHEHEEYHLS